MTRLVLLGTEGCHLCVEAYEIVAQCLSQIAENINVEMIDIAEHSEWQAEYALKIPVLLDSGTGRKLEWPFTNEQVGSFLNQ